MRERWHLTYTASGDWSSKDGDRLESIACRVGMSPRDTIKMSLNQYALRCESLANPPRPAVTRIVKPEYTFSWWFTTAGWGFGILILLLTAIS